MKKLSLYSIIALIFAAGILIQCNTSDKSVKMESSSDHLVTLENAGPISLITIIPKGKTASFIRGTTDEELMKQPSMDHADYYTDDEQPAREIALAIPYEIGRFEITNAQFCRVMNWAVDQKKAKISSGDLKSPQGRLYLGITHLDTSAKYLGIQYGVEISGNFIKAKQGCASHPVHGVTWFGTIAFCNFLSEMKALPPVYDLKAAGWDTLKNGFRLPTEAEWEFAARKDKRYTYAWGDTIDNRFLNYYFSQTGQYDKQTGRFSKSVFKPVGFYNGEAKEGIDVQDNSSPFGIYDMNGNVWEWCWDWYGRDYYQHSPQKDPKGPSQGDDRPPYDVNIATKVWRGCGWAGNNAFSRIAKRWSASPGTSINETGFRIARSLF